MDFLFDLEVPEIQPQKKTVYKKIAITDTCICGAKMRAVKDNGVRKYICDGCGRFVDTRETFENKIEDFTELERNRPIYGNKSGEIYLKKIKEDLMQEINKATMKFTISQEQIIRIVERFLAIRAEKIPRAKPRIGLICACIYEETKIPQEQLCSVYSIKQKYLTDGIKIFAHELLPFNNISIESLIEDMFVKIKTLHICDDTEIILLSIKNIIIEMVTLCNIYYIAYDTTLKTKCAGIIWYLVEAKKIKIDFDKMIRVIDISKNTVFKFYDQFLVLLHAISRKDGLYQVAFTNRQQQMTAYLKYREINIVPIVIKGKFVKYSKVYNFLKLCN